MTNEEKLGNLLLDNGYQYFLVPMMDVLVCLLLLGLVQTFLLTIIAFKRSYGN